MVGTIARRHRRLLRRTCLRGLRVVRRHYFTLLSAGVLGIALAFALTSSSLEISRPTEALPVADAPALQPAATQAASPAVRAAPRELHLIVYYLVSSQTARDELMTAHHSNVADWSFRGTALKGVVHEVLVVRNAQEEAAAMVFLNDLWRLAQVEGFALHYVDLRGGDAGRQ